MGIYNCADTLAEALDSILAQTYTDWEMIMCDDASTDNTAAIARQYADRYNNFLLIRNEHNLGLAATLNHCLEYAESEFIARMDGDDLSLPERFERQVAFLDAHPEYALVSCGMINFDETGDWGRQILKAAPEKRDFIFGSPFCHAPVLMRREALNKVGNYTVRKELRRGQDYWLWHKFYMAGYKGYNLQEAYYKMRDDQNAVHRRKFSTYCDGAKMKWQILADLGFPATTRLVVTRDIVVGLLPSRLNARLHKIKVNHMSRKQANNQD